MSGWFTPDNLRADWYGYATNQGSHALIGIGSAALTAIFWFHFWGEYPPQKWLLTVVMLTFLLSERAQGPFSWDAVEDLMFRGYGAVCISLGLKEQVRFSPGLDPNFGILIPTAFFFSVHLALGSVIRWRQARRATRR